MWLLLLTSLSLNLNFAAPQLRTYSEQPFNAADVTGFGWIDGWMNSYGRKDGYWLLAAGIRVDALWRRGVMLRAGPVLPCLLPRYLPGARLARAPI